MAKKVVKRVSDVLAARDEGLDGATEDALGIMDDFGDYTITEFDAVLTAINDMLDEYEEKN